jgi:AraC-like DNA-binding protein
VTFLRFLAPPLPHFITAAEDTYQPGEAHPRRTAIGVFDMLIVTKGCLPLGEGDDEWEVSAGQGVILRPDMTHYQTEPCPEETHFYVVHFQSIGAWKVISGNEYDDSFGPDALRMEIAQNPYLKPFGEVLTAKAGAVGKTVDVPVLLIEPFMIQLPQHFSLSKSSESYEKLRQLLILQTRPQQTAMWEQQSLFQELLRDIASQRMRPLREFEQLAEQAAEYLRMNFKQNITNETIHEQLHYHPNYITRCMKKVFGCTTLEYLLNYRIEQAKRMLVTTGWSITRISEEAGFRHGSHFSKRFSVQVGVTPNEFRKQYGREFTR